MKWLVKLVRYIIKLPWSIRWFEFYNPHKSAREEKKKNISQMSIINAAILQNLSAWVLSWQAKILPLDNFVSKSLLPLLLLFCIIRLSLRLIKLTILWRENILRLVHLASSGPFSFSSPYSYAFIGCLQYVFQKRGSQRQNFWNELLVAFNHSVK